MLRVFCYPSSCLVWSSCKTVGLTWAFHLLLWASPPLSPWLCPHSSAFHTLRLSTLRTPPPLQFALTRNPLAPSLTQMPFPWIPVIKVHPASKKRFEAMMCKWEKTYRICLSIPELCHSIQVFLVHAFTWRFHLLNSWVNLSLCICAMFYYILIEI